MKVLFVTRLNSFYQPFPQDITCWGLYQEFVNMGINSSLAPLNNIGSMTMHNSRFKKKMSAFTQQYRSGPLRDWSVKRLRNAVKRYSPDVIFTLVEDEAILRIKGEVKLVHWQVEAPYPGQRSPDRFVEGFTDRCDYVFDAARSKYEFMPYAVSYYSPVASEKQYDVTFVGTKYPDRERRLEYMLYPWGRRASVFGRSWEGDPHGLQVHGMADWEDVPRIYSASRICINAQGELGAKMGILNGKMFEMLACGAFVMSDYADRMEEIFEPGKEFILVREDESVVEKGSYYFEHPEEAKKIADAGMKAVRDRHSIRNRAERILEVMKRL